MAQFVDLLRGVPVLEIKGPRGIEITDICFDSRKVQPGGLFVATRGTQVDGHRFIEKAVQGGAHAIVCEELPAIIDETVAYTRVEDASQALGSIAANYCGHPSRELVLVGVTGTNGKTTTATLSYEIARSFGHNAALLSTINTRINDRILASTHTTPDAIRLNEVLCKAVAAGVTHCFMEVSSHAIHQRRIEGLHYSGAVFTNLTHDHLDYHKSMENYFQAKKRFFDDLEPDAFVLTNIDHPLGRSITRDTRAKLYTYSVLSDADFTCRIDSNSVKGLTLRFEGEPVSLKLRGRFNAYNVLATYSIARLLGFDRSTVLSALPELCPVEGRIEYIQAGESAVAIVDYAHTPDALTNVLSSIREFANKGQRIITVIGCGGDRDREKRPVMASIAHTMSDVLVLTSDNPRTEDPEAILLDMLEGIANESKGDVYVIPDRRESIKTACQMATESDIILIAGKGHETYQDIGGVKHHSDDREIVREYLGTRK